MPTPVAIFFSACYDGVALLAADYALSDVKDGHSDAAPRSMVFAFAAASAYVNQLHALIAGEPSAARLAWITPPLAAVVAYELHTRHERHKAQARRGKRYPAPIPTWGAVTWLLFPIGTFVSLRTVVARRSRAMVVAHPGVEQGHSAPKAAPRTPKSARTPVTAATSGTSAGTATVATGTTVTTVTDKVTESAVPASAPVTPEVTGEVTVTAGHEAAAGQSRVTPTVTEPEAATVTDAATGTVTYIDRHRARPPGMKKVNGQWVGDTYVPTSDVRDWLRSQGHSVGERTRLREEDFLAYVASLAQGETA